MASKSKFVSILSSAVYIISREWFGNDMFVLKTFTFCILYGKTDGEMVQKHCLVPLYNECRISLIAEIYGGPIISRPKGKERTTMQTI